MKDYLAGVKGWLLRRRVRQAGKSLAGDVYRSIFGQEADAKDLAACTAFVERTGDIAQLVQILLSPGEHQRKSFAAAAPALVEAAHQSLLGKPPAPAVASAQAARLTGPEQLKTLLDGLVASKEFQRRAGFAPREVVTAVFGGILRRQLDEKNMEIQVDWLTRHPDLTAFLAAVIESPEFQLIMYSKRPAKPRAVLPGRVTIRQTKPRVIVVTSNCQTAGVTATLQALFPNDTFVPAPVPSGPETDSEKRLKEALANADVWVASDWDHLWAPGGGVTRKAHARLVKLPYITFRAFHPDLCYAIKTADGKRVSPAYNSGIAVWAYNKGLDIAETRKLFHRSSYAALGYFNLWSTSTKVLRGYFEECGLDFGRFFMAVKRGGSFMYSINHPKLNAIIELSKLIAVKIGAPESVFDKAVDFPDGLTEDIWPVYPEIAAEYSLPHGSYDWKVWDTWLEGITDYLECAFGLYKQQQIPRGGLKLENRDEALYDRVLGPQAGVR